MPAKLYTKPQLELVEELCRMHDLSPEQISFDGDDLNPIFDYEAVCALSLKLTDIRDIDSWVSDRNLEAGISTAKSKATLADGRSRQVEDSASIGEELGNGQKIADFRGADSLAMNRAVRRVIRSVGVNLYNAHKRFKETGRIAVAHTDHDPRAAALRELHVLATELDLITDGDRTRYEQFIADSFDGATSSKDLNDLDFRRLVNQLRAMARHSRSRKTVPA